jgi:glycosyltransferase involved in cell wall biosynthesis
MKILMIAPQPFMEERGVPFAAYHHIKALGLMGFETDLVTYHLGKTVDLPGLRVFRIPHLPFIPEVKVGPSFAKFPLGALVFFLALWRLCCNRYKYLHTHEEAGFMGVVLSAIFGRPHLYYMHSDLSQQIQSSEFTQSALLIRLARAAQQFITCHADSIIAICPDIQKTAREMSKHTPIYLVENCAVDENLPTPDPTDVEARRKELQLGTGPILLYTGTLESYQGIDLLLHSIPAVLKIHPNARYLLVGGQPDQVEHYQQLARQLSIEDAVKFVGKRPVTEMPLYTALADILLSPRSKGTNTPLKLYTYLRSGKPILATDIFSQTQVLTDETAVLVSPTAEGLTQGALQLLKDPRLATEIGACGEHFAAEHYSWSIFLQKSLQVQKDFTGEGITVRTEPYSLQRAEPYHTENTTGLQVDLEEKTCAA